MKWDKHLESITLLGDIYPMIKFGIFYKYLRDKEFHKKSGQWN
jgi:hypothetical protein